MKTLLLMQTGDILGLRDENYENFDRLFLRMADYRAFAVKVVRVFEDEDPGSGRKLIAVNEAASVFA